MVMEMAPKTNSESTVQIAVQYDQPNYLRLGGAGDLEQPNAVYNQGPSRQETADDDEDDYVVRITTRARITYQLDRFNKHGMLIITNDRNDKTTVNLKLSFQWYNFEVIIIESEEDNPTERNYAGMQIYEFFQQDFSKIGATAVVMSTSTRCFPIAAQADEQVEDRDLLTYFIDHPALQGKPKIFITEARDSAFHDAILLAERVNANVGSTSSTGLPDDVLLIETQMVYNDEHSRPLDLLSQTLDSMNDRRSLDDMLPELYRKATERFPKHRAPIKYHNTLTKELVMDRIANDHRSVV